MPVVWIIACIRDHSLVDADSQPYVDEFWADPVAWGAKYSAIEPAEHKAIDLIVADLAAA